MTSTTATAPPVLHSRRHGKGHVYELDGRRVPGVTTILKMVPKDALTAWAARTCAEYAVNNWRRLSALMDADSQAGILDLSRFLDGSGQLDRDALKAAVDGLAPGDCRGGPAAVLNEIRGAPSRDRDAAAGRGTQVHRLAVGAAAGQDVPLPPGLEGHVRSYISFLDTHDVLPVEAEFTVGNRTVGYCGKPDLVADLGPVEWAGTVIPPARWLLDLKTARSGVFPETALQVCAYARAELYQSRDGRVADMEALGVTQLGSVHVGADGWDLYPLPEEDFSWAYFRHLAWLHAHQDGFRNLVGDAADRPLPA